MFPRTESVTSLGLLGREHRLSTRRCCFTDPSRGFLPSRKRALDFEHSQPCAFKEAAVVSISAEDILDGSMIRNVQHNCADSITFARAAILWKVTCAKGCPLIDVDCG